MKFSTILTTASSLLIANAAPTPAPIADYGSIIVAVESAHKEIDQFGLYSKHEGAGINGVFLSKEGADLSYNFVNQTVYQEFDEYDYAFSVAENNFVQASIALEADKIELIEGYLGQNGNTQGWAACKNINDAYQYSKNEYALMKYENDFSVPEECLSLRLKVKQISIVG